MMQQHTMQDRHRNVRAMMARAGVDALICAGNGHHMIDLDNPVAHMSGYRSVGPALLVLRDDGRTSLLTSPADDREAIGGLPFDSLVAVDDFTAGLRDQLALKGKVGIVGLDDMPIGTANAILAALGEAPLQLNDLFSRTTAPKTGAELDATRRATTIAEAGYRYLLDVVRPGMRECDLAIDVNLHMRSLGANDSFLMLNCGPRQDAVMPSSERRIELGDLLLCELSPSVAGQFTQICRTVSIGPARDETKAKYPLLVAAMHEGINKVAPGVRLGDVCAAIDDHLSEAGYAQFSRPPFIRRRGHGLGSGSTAPGDVSVDNDALLEPGMLFMVHPNQFLPETGYMMCGEPVVVTQDGFEILTQEMAALATAGGIAS